MPIFTKRYVAITLSLLVVAALGAIGAGITTDTLIVDDTITTETINATSLSVIEISGHRVSGQLDMAGNRITDVQNPVNCQDVATKDYVDLALGQMAGGADSSGQVTVINDGEMADSDWTWEQYDSNYPATVSHKKSGGNPDAYRKIVHYEVSAAANDNSGTINKFNGYNMSPANLEGLKELQMSVQSYFEYWGSQQLQYGQINIGFMVYQGSKRYQTFGTTTGTYTWLTTVHKVTRAQLLGAGFDLSPTGQPLQFGFTTRHSWVFANAMRYDNFKVIMISSYLPSPCG